MVMYFKGKQSLFAGSCGTFCGFPNRQPLKVLLNVQCKRRAFNKVIKLILIRHFRPESVKIHFIFTHSFGLRVFMLLR